MQDLSFRINDLEAAGNVYTFACKLLVLYPKPSVRAIMVTYEVSYLMSSRNNNRRRSTLRQMRLVSIGTSIVALFTLGLILLLRVLAIGVETNVKENIGLTIELLGEDPHQQYLLLEQQLPRLKGVKALKYVDADQAMQQMIEHLGEDPVAILGYNPLAATVQLSLDATYMHPDSLDHLQRELALLGVGTQLNYREDLVEAIERNSLTVEYVLWGVLALQILFAFIQINNTIRLMIYSDRLKIRTLTLVGAGAWFIRRPVVLRSLGDAGLAALGAILLLGGLVYSLERGLSISILSLLRVDYVLMAAGVVVLVALLGSAIASVRSTGKYIRMNGDKIHLV